MSKVSLIMATLNGLAPWKKTERILSTAKGLGMETVVAMDQRSTDHTAEVLANLIDTHVPFHNDKPYCEEILNDLIEAARSEWCFLVSDDEWPSDELWAFTTKAQRKPQRIYRPHLIATLPDGRRYRPLDTRQPRVFLAGSIRWPTGGIDILPVRALPEEDIDPILWHYNLHAPRAFREAKAAAHEEAWGKNYDAHPWPYPGRKSYLYEDYPEEIE